MTPLDWTVPISEQIISVENDTAPDARYADIIMAAETVWLEELVAPFVSTVMDILRGMCISVWYHRVCFSDGTHIMKPVRPCLYQHASTI